MTKQNNNMELWDAVCKTNPKHTKKANVRGNKITAIAPQTQIKQATEQWGVYGISWGWESFEFDYHLLDTTGIVIFKGVFYFPKGKFPISSSISAYKDGARTNPDADFAKKVETDALTKGLSKVGFNADVFMGSYDDNKYVAQMEGEFAEVNKPIAIWQGPIKKTALKDKIRGICSLMDELTAKDSVDHLKGIWIDNEDALKQVKIDLPDYYESVVTAKDKAKNRINTFPADIQNDDNPFNGDER